MVCWKTKPRVAASTSARSPSGTTPSAAGKSDLDAMAQGEPAVLLDRNHRTRPRQDSAHQTYGRRTQSMYHTDNINWNLTNYDTGWSEVSHVHAGQSLRCMHDWSDYTS
jgi:hypothetical protein